MEVTESFGVEECFIESKWTVESLMVVKDDCQGKDDVGPCLATLCSLGCCIKIRI